MQAHHDVASSCIAYIFHTNRLGERKNKHPLRGYAWDLWALHVVASTTDTTMGISDRAQYLYEETAFRSDNAVPVELQQFIRMLDYLHCLHCLRHPYFFEEFAEDGFGYKSLKVENNEIRLLRILPNQNSFTGIRCTMIHTTLDAPQEYEAISYARWGPNITKATKYIWVDGHRFAVPANGQASLRAIRESNPQGRLVWLDAICIDRSLYNELSRHSRQLRSRIFASAASVTVYLEDIPEEGVWALEILRLIEQLLEPHSDNVATDLAKLLRSRQSTNPFVWLKFLFERLFWATPEVLNDVVESKNPMVLYGIHALPFARLQTFVNLAPDAFRLIRNAAPNAASHQNTLERSEEWQNVLYLIRMRAQHLQHSTVQKFPEAPNIRGRVLIDIIR